MSTSSYSTLVIIYLLFLGACQSASEKVKQVERPPSTEAPVTKGFDEMQQDYYESSTRVIWQKPELVLQLLGELEGKVVADIGAGTGYFAFRIAGQGGEVVAIDVDPRAISYMEAEELRYPLAVQEKFTTRLAKPDDPTLHDREVNVVLMVNTYIYLQDREAYLRRVGVGLSSPGEILIIDFKKMSTPIGPELDQRIPQEQVEQDLRQAGYAIAYSDTSTLEYQYIVRAIKPE